MGKTERRKPKGFTLIELLVVLMLIGILASLAMGRFLNARDKGHVAAASCDLDNVRKLLAYYTADWNSYPPSAASYQDLADQLVDSDGHPLGTLPTGGTYQFLSYALDANQDYILRVRALDNGGTVLRASPETIERE